MQRRCCCPPERPSADLLRAVFDLVPHGGAAQRLFDDGVEVRPLLDTEGAGAVGDVVIHAHRKRVGALEHHAHVLAEACEIDAALVDVGIADLDLARYFTAVDKVVHAVERFQERRLAAARGPDERRELLLRELHIDVFEGLEAAVEEVHLMDGDGNVPHRKLRKPPLLLRAHHFGALSRGLVFLYFFALEDHFAFLR